MSFDITSFSHYLQELEQCPELIHIISSLPQLQQDKVTTKSQVTSYIITKLICSSQKIDSVPVTLPECYTVANDTIKSALISLSHVAFVNHTHDSPPSPLEISNVLLCNGFPSLPDLKPLGLLTSTDTFHHDTIQCYMAAFFLINSSLMFVIKFIVSQLFMLPPAKWLILEMYYSLATTTTIYSTVKESLFYITSYICQSFNGGQPLVDNPVVLLILRCLHEAGDNTLCLQVHFEILRSHIFSYSIDDVDRDTIRSFAYYITRQDGINWKVLCTNQDFIQSLTTEVRRFRKRSSPFLLTRDTSLKFGNNKRFVITLRSEEYVRTTLTEYSIEQQGIELEGAPLEQSAFVQSDRVTQYDRVTLLTRQVRSSSTSYLQLVQYGYYSREQYETRRQIDVVTFFNIVKDLLTTQLQHYCPTVMVQSQYRKGDHVWLSFTSNVRHDFYQAVRLYPILSIHWAKVKQPNGSNELEDKYRRVSMEIMRSPSAISTNDVAELVILNSNRPIHCMVTPPTGENPQLIRFYDNSDEVEELGFVGCDYLTVLVNDEKWKQMDPFESPKDEKIVCQLPLPSNRGVESGEMPMASKGSTDMSTSTVADQSKLRVQVPYSKPSVSIHTSSNPQQPPGVIEQQVKKHALEAYDKSGYCFYASGERFKVGVIYVLPDAMGSARILREGGNGTILEVLFEGTFYAVKCTAFRWREVLIMPKLHHPNILPVVCMIMGNPVPSYTRRRYVYHYYPRMTNDLGRNVGSYERFCLRSLKERYKMEFLLLKKIQSNFKYVCHEILQGLNYLHTLSNPVIHRDIKPSNILLLMACDCVNVLACVCRNRPVIIYTAGTSLMKTPGYSKCPYIRDDFVHNLCLWDQRKRPDKRGVLIGRSPTVLDVISDFDASLELSSTHTLLPDPPRMGMKDFYTTIERTYHISPVGTIGYKPPEASMYKVSNSDVLMRELSTKADIFSFGFVVALMILNEEGPKTVNQMGTMLLSMYQSINQPQPLNAVKKTILLKHKVMEHRKNEFCVIEKDIHRILPIPRLRRVFMQDMPQLVDFVEKCLQIDPSRRPSAQELLNHRYITEINSL